ncbi:hypothetical protein [uncultured Mailhella sp.]|uniref:hypothetical protein n=1 Tax=uncultured Mailhella sp. TaxID=1981031 RepID=UPI0025E635DD|nr:hypothetical protein [uncultured Mailhella sp.]
MFSFWKMTPGGNPTILFKAEDIPHSARAMVANAVMSDQHIGAEQAGYVRFEGTPRLDMMGGEFCLNATRCFAVLLAEQGLLAREGNALAGRVEVSGVPDTVAVRVLPRKNDLPFAEACLHFSALPEPEAFPGNVSLVRVPGIAHIIQTGQVPSRSLLASFCSQQRLACSVAEEEAVGHLWLKCESPSPDGQQAELHPVVWVRDTGSLCSESACGSGTLASAVLLHARTGAERFRIVQPSGCALFVRMEHSTDGWDIWVGGPVRMTVRGETDLTGIL